MMTTKSLHSWTLDPDEAIQLQESLRSLLVLAWDGRAVNSIGGVEVRDSGNMARAAITLLAFPEMTRLEAVYQDYELDFPYLPGLLAFRLGSPILAAWEKLMSKPDLLMIHGHGIAHPRGLGLASHMGLWLGMPTIGVAKSRLYGIHSEPGPMPGDWSEVRDENNPQTVIGVVIRTRIRSKPVYVSPGHMIDLPHSIEFVMQGCRGFRMPEPIRLAHQAAIAWRTNLQISTA